MEQDLRNKLKSIAANARVEAEQKFIVDKLTKEIEEKKALIKYVEDMVQSLPAKMEQAAREQETSLAVASEATVCKKYFDALLEAVTEFTKKNSLEIRVEKRRFGFKEDSEARTERSLYIFWE